MATDEQGFTAFTGTLGGEPFIGFKGNSETNDAPTIDPFTDFQFDEDSGPSTFDFTGVTNGGDKVPQPIKVTATSDNQDLFPDPTVNYSSPDLTGSLTFEPLPDQHGTATITVNVTDGGLDLDLDTPDDNAVTIETFKVTVTPVNDPPTIHPIPDQATHAFAGELTIPFSGVTSGPFENQPLSITATTNSAYLFSGPLTVDYVQGESHGELRITPNPDQHGTGTITVRVTDTGDDEIPGNADDQSDSTTFKVTVRGLDFGDLPDDGTRHYQTLLASDGARHVIVEGAPVLGTLIDAEPNGQPGMDASGDDLAGTKDEDGVIVPLLVPGTTATMLVHSTAPGFLSAWIDIHGLGRLDPLENQIASAMPVVAGVNEIEVKVPLYATPGNTYARFRITSSSEPLLPTGLAEDGEVEDYQVTIAEPISISISDSEPQDTSSKTIVPSMPFS